MRKILYILGLILLISALLSSCADSEADNNHVTLPASVSSDQNPITKPETVLETEDTQPPQTVLQDETEANITQPDLDAQDVTSQPTEEPPAITSHTTPISTSPTTTEADSQTVTESKPSEPSSDYEDGIVIPEEGILTPDDEDEDMIYQEVGVVEPPYILSFSDYSEYSYLIESAHFSDEDLRSLLI